MDAYADADPILKAVCVHWETKLEHARNHKRKAFQDDADEMMGFFNGPRDWDAIMGGKIGLRATELMPDTTFKMSVNKAFELVTLFGPTLYYQNPVRTITPRSPVEVPMEAFPDPYLAQAVYTEQQQQLLADSMRASVLEPYLNWTPIENDLAGDSRSAIEEALIKGRGCLWTELVTPPGTTFRVVKSTWDSVDSLLIDPDATSLKDASWIARRCCHPVWMVERDYGIPHGTLQGNLESQAIGSEVAASDDALYDRRRGLTNDLICYWKIYSKMGIGGRLSGISKSFRGPLEMFGDYCYLVLAKGVPFPLNLPTNIQQKLGAQEEVLDRVAWPTPFWAHGEWPVSPLDFHKIPNCPWPMSHLRAGIGELKFLNWAMSFLAGKLRNTTRDFLAVKKEAGEEIKTTLLEGRDLSILEIEADHKSVAELIQVLQFNPVNADIWKLIEAVEENFNKRVGLNELLYGDSGGTQIRSAQEASIRNQNTSVRPDDMAKQVEAWMSLVAFKEALCARYHLQSADITPVLGQLAGSLWDQYVSSQDLNVVTRQLDCRIEAGSTKKPNKETQQSQMTEGMQVLVPILETYSQMTGDLMPLNNLIADWAKSRDLNPARYQLTYSAPAPQPGGGGEQFGEAQGGSGEQFAGEQPAS